VSIFLYCRSRGRTPWATAISWRWPAASPILINHIGFSTAAAHYGLTTQHRNVIYVVTPMRLRAREVGEARVRIVNPSSDKFFGFEPVDVLGYKVVISDREKTAIDCVDRPALAGGVGEAP
jgi:predicted transcriptional regulator of viral defense system